MADVIVDGERLAVDPGAYPTASLVAIFRCASGDPIPGEWRGAPVDALLDDADAPPGTTHLLVRGADGFRICLPVVDALDGVLAIERRPVGGDGTGDRGGRDTAAGGYPVRDQVDATGLPRFVAPDISGTRTVKAVERIDPVALDPDEDPERYEDLLLGAPEGT